MITGIHLEEIIIIIDRLRWQAFVYADDQEMSLFYKHPIK